MRLQIRSISSALLSSFIFTSITVSPALALRNESTEGAGVKGGVANALRQDTAGLEEAPAWVWAHAPAGIPAGKRADLTLEAKRFVADAFAVGGAIPVAGHGKKARIPKKLQEVASFTEQALSELDMTGEDVGQSPLLSDDSGVQVDPAQWARENVRVVIVQDDNNGFLAAEGVAGTDTHVAVTAYAGWHPYPGWEEGRSPEMAEAIRRGMRAQLANGPLQPNELPGPPTVYLSETQVRGFMKGGEEGKKAFAIKLAHEVADVLRRGKHVDEPPARAQVVNDYIAKNMQAIEEAKRAREEAERQRLADRVVKVHVTADLGELIWTATPEQRRAIAQAIEDHLEAASREGSIYGHNAFLFNHGRQVTIDFDHKGGLSNPEKYRIAYGALMAGLRKAQELGVLLPVDGTGKQIFDMPLAEQMQILQWHEDENAFTQRAAEPVLTIQGIGVGAGALNRAIWLALVGDAGHLQAVGGERGFRVEVVNLSDLREGKEHCRTHTYDVPGIHEDTLVEIVRKIQDGTLTEEDLRDQTVQNLHQLHRLIGASDEYAIRAVYALPGSKFGRTDEPIIKVDLHDNPTATWRVQSGSWATGTAQKVLTMPYAVTNAGQTKWVWMIPISLEEADDPSLMDWPVGEMGFITAWSWSYDRGGTGRGEPPQTDVFGKNDQTSITREVVRPLVKNWGEMGAFEPRLTAAEAARRAGAAAGRFEAVPQGTTGIPPIGLWAPIPDLKKGEDDPLLAPFQGEGHRVASFFKADIGGKAGHDQVLQIHMAAARAKLEEAKQAGLIVDYYVFCIGDDVQFAILHDHGVHDSRIQELAWQAFSFGYWASWTLGLEPYGHAQDIKIAEEFKKHPIERHANLTRRAVELLQAECARGAAGQGPAPTEAYGKRQAQALGWALERQGMLDASLGKWESGASGSMAAESVAVGNVTGMGIGWIEFPLEEGDEEMGFYGLDKSGAGGFNARLVRGLYEAVEDGDLSADDIVEIYDVEERRRIFLKFGEHEAQIRDMAAQVNKYNFKRVYSGETGKVLAVFSSEILAKTAHGYVGKDDPISGMKKRIAKHLLDTFRRVELAVTPQLGDEAGSHNMVNVLRAWYESYPGERSNPVAVGMSFRFGADGTIQAEDEGSKPEFKDGREAAERFNQSFVTQQGEFSPLVANRHQLEDSYLRAAMLAKADANPTGSIAVSRTSVLLAPPAVPSASSASAGLEAAAAASAPTLAEVVDRLGRLLEARTERAAVGVIAGPMDPQGWAYGVALLNRGRTSAGESIPVVFLVEDEAAVRVLSELGVSPEAVHLVGSPEYPTREIAIQKAMDRLAEQGRTNIVPLGVTEPISPLVEQVLAALFGIRLDVSAAVEWEAAITGILALFL